MRNILCIVVLLSLLVEHASASGGGDGDPVLQVRSISAGNQLCLQRSMSGQVIAQDVQCLGENTLGQLGIPSSPGLVPRFVRANVPIDSYRIFGGSNSTCALTGSDHLGMSCWGKIDFRVATTGFRTVSGVGIPVSFRAENEHSLFTTTDGKLFYLGNPRDHGFDFDRAVPDPVSGTELGVQLDMAGFNAGRRWQSVDMSGRIACGIAQEGNNAPKVYCWGVSLSTGGYSSVPVIISGLTNPSQISVGSQHACAIDNGAVKCWGDNAYGQIGQPRYQPTADYTNARLVANLSAGANTVSLSYNTSCATQTVSGVRSLKCWGSNAQLMLGVSYVGMLQAGTTRYSSTPVPVGIPGGVGLLLNTKGNYASGTFACATSATEQELYCWGRGIRTIRNLPYSTLLTASSTAEELILAGGVQKIDLPQ